jgi:hypothetical protein
MEHERTAALGFGKGFMLATHSSQKSSVNRNTEGGNHTLDDFQQGNRSIVMFQAVYSASIVEVAMLGFQFGNPLVMTTHNFNEKTSATFGTDSII